jgi:hypothetical protein
MENNKSVTAVEWLLENLNSEPYSEEEFNYNRDCWDKAKEMEKEQIKEAWLNSLTKGDFNSAEEYYNETFKSE